MKRNSLEIRLITYLGGEDIAEYIDQKQKWNNEQQSKIHVRRCTHKKTKID